MGVEFPSPPADVRRYRLPDVRFGRTHEFVVANQTVKITVGLYPDGRLGEIFVRMDKEGSTLSGMLDAWSIALSVGLQHGVPSASFTRKFRRMKFKPSGFTDNRQQPTASSVVDYVCGWLDHTFPGGSLPMAQVPGG